ncbi:hypothetical protein BDV12DRAFT_192028 [Aspergillus spectabilis]
MSVVDPALVFSSHPDDEDSDWEYEYHDTETEVGMKPRKLPPTSTILSNSSPQTFFLNLDLTTHHGPIRPPRRRNDPSTSIPTTTVTTANPTPAPSRPDDQDPAVTTSETHNASAERFQILGLHTRNPIISYQNQIFSGSWADQLGTELFFTRPGTTSSGLDDSDSTPTQLTPLKHTKDFDLISANSVKIISRKANLISSSGSAAAAEQRETSFVHSSTPDTSTLSYKPEHQSSQTRFLERLKDIKRRRGETDTVRTIFSTYRRGPNLEERLRGWVQTEEQLALIQQLNDRAVQGDVDAVRELERMYTQLGSQDAGSSEGPSRSA